MPTLVRLRRRGYTPEATATSAAIVWPSDACCTSRCRALHREDLNVARPRDSVLRPLRLVTRLSEGLRERTVNNPKSAMAAEVPLLSRGPIEQDASAMTAEEFPLAPGADCGSATLLRRCTGCQGSVPARSPIALPYDPPPARATLRRRGQGHTLGFVPRTRPRRVPCTNLFTSPIPTKKTGSNEALSTRVHRARQPAAGRTRLPRQAGDPLSVRSVGTSRVSDSRRPGCSSTHRRAPDPGQDRAATRLCLGSRGAGAVAPTAQIPPIPPPPASVYVAPPPRARLR